MLYQATSNYLICHTLQVKSLQRAFADEQQSARDRQDAEALQELGDADKVVRGLGPGGDLCVNQTEPSVFIGRNFQRPGVVMHDGLCSMTSQDDLLIWADVCRCLLWRAGASC
jgi:hypothetical protein